MLPSQARFWQAPALPTSPIVVEDAIVREVDPAPSLTLVKSEQTGSEEAPQRAYNVTIDQASLVVEEGGDVVIRGRVANHSEETLTLNTGVNPLRVGARLYAHDVSSHPNSLREARADASLARIESRGAGASRLGWRSRASAPGRTGSWSIS